MEKSNLNFLSSEFQVTITGDLLRAKNGVSPPKSHIMPFPSPSTDDLCLKLERLASRHKQLKISYHELKSQINAGLLEVKEVFTSLAIPLMKLVGLKTKEMEEEGPFNSIIIDNEFSHGGCEIGLESKSSDATRGGEQKHHIGPSEGENYAARATMAGKELMKKQHTNLVQLVHLLRRMEIHVNTHQDDILETLGMHRLSPHKFFPKAICCISAALHSQNHDTYSMTLKLLQAIFNNVYAVLGSVEGSVGNLIQELAENMCNPMVEYVKGLKDDMKNGISVQLLAMVEEMERMMSNGKLELEDARNKVRVAEERKIEAICKLKAMEKRVRSMKQRLTLPEPEAQRGHVDSREHSSPPQKGWGEEQAKDDKLLWKLLKKKRKYQVQASPMGPRGLLWSNAVDDHCHPSRTSELRKSDDSNFVHKLRS